MVLSNDVSILENIRDMRDYDEKERHRMRFNYKMTEMQGAMGLSQLRKLDWFLARRRELSRRYGREERTCFRFVVAASKASTAILKFEASRIRARPPVFMPLHRSLGRSDSSFSETARAVRRNVSVPLYPGLTEKETERILSVMDNVFQ